MPRSDPWIGCRHEARSTGSQLNLTTSVRHRIADTQDTHFDRRGADRRTTCAVQPFGTSGATEGKVAMREFRQARHRTGDQVREASRSERAYSKQQLVYEVPLEADAAAGRVHRRRELL